MRLRLFPLALVVFLGGLLFLSGLSLLTGQTAANSAADSFDTHVKPFLKKNCAGCHNQKLNIAGVNLDAGAGGARREDDALWEHVATRLTRGDMPPKGLPRPQPEEVQAVQAWIERHLAARAQNLTPDPGRVTARRLNRAEYNNTVRDLLGVDLRPADDFPVDDSGYGFDNIGDVLSLPPVLMERYLTAARKLSEAVIVVPEPPQVPTLDRYPANRAQQETRPNLENPSQPGGAHRVSPVFPRDAEYLIRVRIVDRRKIKQEDVRLSLWLDGAHQGDFVIPHNTEERPREFETRLSIPRGAHEIAATLHREYLDLQDPDPTAPPPDHSQRKVFVDFIEIGGPYNVRPPALTPSHRNIMICGHPLNEHEPACARRILAPLLRRAWRRPVLPEEVDRIAGFVSLARQEGESFEAGIRLALQALLVSPHFLFRIERGQPLSEPGGHLLLTDLELASRLSYFLWSSMPDEELLSLAEARKLREPGVLEAQVRRMIRDPKSAALAANFAGQWLQLRNLQAAKPDPDKFPHFDEELREAMYRETELFFHSIVAEDRPITEFLTARYTFLNERLARHYGIEGVKGSEFRKVALTSPQRGGILTHASILTISSYPTRTSPVLRGLWIQENLLGAPPPPPPPNVPELQTEGIGATASLRERLEAHRANPACAVCHDKIDPLGFGLENYDAIGQWRTHDGKFPIDASGALPNGRAFRDAFQFREAFLQDQDTFVLTLTQRLLTYALGRGLERFDKPVVEQIAGRVSQNGYRFSSLVMEIVNSMPFQMRRGEGARS